MPRHPIRTASLLALVVLTVNDRLSTPGQAEGPAQDPPVVLRAEDREAIRAVLESFALAFSSRDATALAAHWTNEGEYRDENGTLVRGKVALETAFAEFFATTPEVTALVQPDQLRFLSSDLAIEEGTVTIKRGPTEPSTRASYSALFVREEGRWRLASLSESPPGDPSIDDLDWLIGDWRSSVDESTEIQVSYAWNPHRTFIVSRFVLKDLDREISGTQVIGVDPAIGTLRTWSFEADGGVGGASWARDGDHWVLDAVGTLADGRTLSETNILRRLNENAFTWQSVNRMLDDASLPDHAPVKVLRVIPEP